MRNLLSLLGALGLTATTTTTVIACGSGKNHVIQKTALRDLHLKTRLSNPTTDSEEAFETFIELNAEVSDLHDSVSIDVFLPPGYSKDGTLQVQAKTNTKYSGTLDIIIPSLIKTDIANLITKTTIQGVENMTVDDAFNAFIQANPNVLDLRESVSFGDFQKPEYKTNGSLTISAKPGTKYSGSMTVTITAIGQEALAGLSGIVSEVPSNTTKATALQNFLDLNKAKYPDLIKNLTLDDTSFVASSYSKAGSYTINAISDGKYSGSVVVTIPMKVKVKLEDAIKNTQLTGNVSENEVIEKILAANPNSGVTASDLEVTDFVAPQIATPGGATITAVGSSGFVGGVKITIVLLPQDAELKEIIDEINKTPSKTLAAIEIWKKYFAYYSQEKTQYLVNLLNTKYIVWTTESQNDWLSSLTKQVKDNVSDLLDKVIVGKDGLGNNRYDDFEIESTQVGDNGLDKLSKLFTIKMTLNFIWYAQNDIKSTTTLTETRTITIKFVAENPS